MAATSNPLAMLAAIDEFKREAVGLLASSGRPLSQIARELSIAASMLRAWRDAGGRRKLHHLGCTERENLASDAKGKGTSGSIREAESADALERGGLLRSSYEAGVMLAERRGQIASLVVPADIKDLPQHVVTPPPRRAARFRNAARFDAPAILCAVLTSAIWENAWGKLPTKH
jgi:transposase-like protein